jgi:uncharacterized membrane protein
VREDDERPAAGPRTRDEYDVSRLLALSDGVFAIAMTLLVLNVPVPQLPAAATDEQVRKAFFDVLPNIAVFVLSFLLVGVYWLVHHRQFMTVRSIDQRLAWLNLIALLTVCLMPFTTSFFSRFTRSVTATEVYYGNLVVAGVAFLVLTTYGHRTGMLPLREGRQALVAARSLAPIAVFAGGMLLAPVWEEGARWAFVALFPLNLLVNRVFSTRR